MQDKEYRQIYRDARNRELLAMQIRALREKREWTQEQLGTHAGGMRQERISVLEDADNGSITYKTLARLADAFDVDLIVRFAPYSEMERWVRDMGPDQLAVAGFDEDPGQVPHVTAGEANNDVDGMVARRVALDPTPTEYFGAMRANSSDSENSPIDFVLYVQQRASGSSDSDELLPGSTGKGSALGLTQVAL